MLRNYRQYKNRGLAEIVFNLALNSGLHALSCEASPEFNPKPSLHLIISSDNSLWQRLHQPHKVNSVTWIGNIDPLEKMPVAGIDLLRRRLGFAVQGIATQVGPHLL